MVVSFVVGSSSSFRDISKNHLVTVVDDTGDRIKQSVYAKVLDKNISSNQFEKIKGK